MTDCVLVPMCSRAGEILTQGGFCKTASTRILTHMDMFDVDWIVVTFIHSCQLIKHNRKAPVWPNDFR